MDIRPTEKQYKWATKKTVNVTFKLTEHERQQLRDISKALGVSANSWFRSQIRVWQEPFLRDCDEQI